MQAPTTPSGPPAQEPDERPCAGCGAGNALSAAFCWQCYRPFSGPGATAVAGSGRATAGPGRPVGAWAPSTVASPPVSANRSNALGSMAVVVVATLVTIGAAWFLFFRQDAVSLPEAFGGMPQIEDAQTALVVDTFRAELEDTGVSGDIAVYGNGTPSAALIWIRDASVPTTDAAFDEFAAGFNAGVGSNGSLGRTATETIGGVTYVCAPVLGAAPGTICMWQDQDVFWLLFDFSGDPFGAGRDLAVVAHDAVVQG